MQQAASPFVSVIIPVFNGATYLERTILSAAGQDYGNLEIIVVDDGSTDATPEILERLRAQVAGLRVIRTENGGVARARNVGTEASRADYVAYLDADDLWHPTKISKQVSAMQNHRGDRSWAACYALFRTINADDEVLGNCPPHIARGAIFPSHLIENHVGNGSSLLVRRDAALEVGGFDPEYAEQGIGGCEDRDFQFRLLRRYRMEIAREYLIGYRSYPGNMSSNHFAMAFGNIAVCRKFSGDERVSTGLRRMALASTCGYAFIRLMVGREVTGAARVFLMGLFQNPFVFMGSVSKRVWDIARRKSARTFARVFVKAGFGSVLKKQTYRNFSDYDPAEGLSDKLEFIKTYTRKLQGYDEAFEHRLSD